MLPVQLTIPKHRNMGKSTRKFCPDCKKLEQRVAALEAELASQRAREAELQEKLAQAKKNSSTSSKPPSSDIVKPPPPATDDGRKRAIGGQPGHERHKRPLLPFEQLTDGSHAHVIDLCPCCGHGLEPGTPAPKVVQKIDIREMPIG